MPPKSEHWRLNFQNWSPPGDSRFSEQNFKNASYKQESSFFLSSQMKITDTDHCEKIFSQKQRKPSISFVTITKQFLASRHSTCLFLMAWILVLSVLPVSSFPESNRVPGYYAWNVSLPPVFQANFDGKTVWTEEILVNFKKGRMLHM